MSMFSLKRIFDREREIMRLRRANESLNREILLQPQVFFPKEGSNYLFVVFPEDKYTGGVYKRLDGFSVESK